MVKLLACRTRGLGFESGSPLLSLQRLGISSLIVVISGVSNLFSSGARSKTAGAPRFEAEGFTEARSAERGRGAGGVSPGNFFLKIASKWCILVYFGTVNANFKTDNLYEINIYISPLNICSMYKSQMFINQTFPSKTYSLR